MGTSLLIRVAIVDAQQIFCAGVQRVLEPFAEISVVGSASCVVDARALCERHRPDVLLLDGALPGALTLLGHLRERQPKLRVVMLGDRAEPALITAALDLGVRAYLLKTTTPLDLFHAVRAAASGMLTLAPEVVAAMRDANDRPEPFSAREQEVLDLLVQGRSNEAIAAALHVSRSTVKFHLSNVFTKLGVRTRAEAIARVYEGQLSPAPRPPSLQTSSRLPVRSVAV